MKKSLKWICLLLLCATMLTSCGTVLNVMPAATTANQVVRRMNARLASLDGYRIDVEGTITAYADTTKITGTLEGFAIEDQGKNKDDYYYHTEMTNRSKTNNANVTIKTTEAYYDGYAYSHYSEGSTWRKLCSPMTKKEYLDYISDDSLFELETDDCKSRQFEKTEDGYTVNYADYSTDAIEDFFEKMDLDEDLFGKMPEDLKITITTDADYYPKTFTFEMVFEENKNSYYKPEFSMTMTFSQFNEVERKTNSLSPDKYKEIESLALLEEVEELINDRIDAKEGSFTTETRASVNFMSQSNTETETNKVTFSRNKQGFTFETEVTKKDDSQHISYSNGEKTIRYSDDKTYTTKMSEDDAEKFIAELLNDPVMGYHKNYVADIKATEDGYEISMDVGESAALGQIITSAGAKFSSGSHTIKIKVEDGKITKIEHGYRASGTVQIGINQKATLNYTGSMTVTFDK